MDLGAFFRNSYYVNNMPFHENRLMIPTHEWEVIAALFPREKQEERNGPLGAVLVAIPAYRYQGHTIKVINHKSEDGDPLMFTVNLSLEPKSFDKLSDACEFIDGFMSVAGEG